MKRPVCCTSSEWVRRLRTAALRSSGKTCVFCCRRRTAAELMMRPRSLSNWSMTAPKLPSLARRPGSALP